MQEVEQPSINNDIQSKNKKQEGQELTAESEKSALMLWSPFKLVGHKRALEESDEFEDTHDESEREEGEMNEDEDETGNHLEGNLDPQNNKGERDVTSTDSGNAAPASTSVLASQAKGGTGGHASSRAVSQDQTVLNKRDSTTKDGNLNLSGQTEARRAEQQRITVRTSKECWPHGDSRSVLNTCENNLERMLRGQNDNEKNDEGEAFGGPEGEIAACGAEDVKPTAGSKKRPRERKKGPGPVKEGSREHLGETQTVEWTKANEKGNMGRMPSDAYIPHPPRGISTEAITETQFY